jgi:hypothetical protein
MFKLAIKITEGKFFYELFKRRKKSFPEAATKVSKLLKVLIKTKGQ